MKEWQPSDAMRKAAVAAKDAALDFDINPSAANRKRLRDAIDTCRRVALADCEKNQPAEPTA